MDALVAVIERLNPGIKEDEIKTKVLPNYLQRWRYLGLWPSQDQGTHYYWYPKCVVTVWAFVDLFVIYNIFAERKDFITTVMHICMIAVLSITAVKILAFLCYPAEMNDLCHDLEALHESHRTERVPHTTAILRQTLTISWFFGVHGITVFYVLLTLTAILVGGILFTKGESALRFDYSCDLSHTPCLVLCVVFECFFGVTCWQLNYPIIVFLVDVQIRTLSEFKILNYNLTTIREFAVQEVDKEFETNEGQLPTTTVEGALQGVSAISEDGNCLDEELAIEEVNAGPRGEFHLDITKELKYIRVVPLPSVQSDELGMEVDLEEYGYGSGINSLEEITCSDRDIRMIRGLTNLSSWILKGRQMAARKRAIECNFTCV